MIPKCVYACLVVPLTLIGLINCSGKVVAQTISIHDRANWFISIGAGVQFPEFNPSITVNNNSGFPHPYNEDIYSTIQNSKAVIGAEGGRRWERDSRWLNAYSLGLFYQYFFATNAGRTVMQYSLPEFTNYNVSWNLSSNLLLATAKLNLFESVSKVSPFINGGMGVAFNHSSDYAEFALSGVTPRVSPGFANNTTSQFAYALGVGIDYQIRPPLVVSLGYNYQNLGKFSSGAGMGSWIGQSLHLGTYQSNNVFVAISYILEK